MNDFIGIHKELEFKNERLFKALNNYVYGFKKDIFHVLSLINKFEKDDFTRYLGDRNNHNINVIQQLKSKGINVSNATTFERESKKLLGMINFLSSINNKSFPNKSINFISYFLNVLESKRVLKNILKTSDSSFCPVVTKANSILEITELTTGLYFKFFIENEQLFIIKNKEVMFFKENDKKEIIKLLKEIRKTKKNKKEHF